MLLTVGILLIHNVAVAEWFGDIYLGLTYTQVDNMDIKVDATPVAVITDSDTGQIFGVRFGYWFEGAPWLGLAGDFSASQLDFDTISIGVGSLTPLVMARLPLRKSEAYPNGKIQPFVGIGPGFFFGGMSDFIPEVPPNGAVLEDQYFVTGIDARGGLTVLFKKSYGIFFEYIFKSFSPSFTSTARGGGNISFEPTFDTHHFSVGVTFRF